MKNKPSCKATVSARHLHGAGSCLCHHRSQAFFVCLCYLVSDCSLNSVTDSRLYSQAVLYYPEYANTFYWTFIICQALS